MSESKNHKTCVESDVLVLSDLLKEDSDFLLEKNAKPADFETAISACGFGKFNIILYIISTTAGWSSIFETTTMSYVFPAAECDLQLTLGHKGLLNAVTYSGMISSAFIWGFLCDTLGRKKLLLIGFLLDGLFVIMAASSQSFTLLMIAKFLGGFIINGPFAALTSYLSEFHCSKHRARVQMILGTIFSLGSFILPILALGILPIEINLNIGNYFLFHSWNLYLLICSLPALISGIAFIFLPESPKFLMTIGRKEKALRVFKRVYAINTGKPEETYPIKELVDETIANNENSNKRGGRVTANRTKVQALREGWQQIRPLFFPPHVARIFLVFTMQCMIMMSLNTLRLWLPQIFQAMNDYQYYNNNTANLCTMLDVFKPKNRSLNFTEGCTVNYNNSQVYTNAMIVAFTSVIGYIAAGTLINTLGKKKLLSILGIVSGSTAMTLYFSTNIPTTIALSAIFVTFGSIGINVILSVVVDLFPTTLRTMTVSLTMMCGRLGAAMGNVVFPYLLQAGCAPPFFSVGSVMIVSDGPAEFETAITATGYGKFNIIMFLVIFPSYWAFLFESIIMSYVSPAAECDLELTLSNRGVLNAISFIGATVGTLFWGFLIDRFGRKRLLAIGFYLEVLIVAITSLAQSFTFLVIIKFFGGLVGGGLYVGICTYLSEFHSTKMRGKIQLATGFADGCGQIFLPLLASLFLPMKLNVTFFNGFINYHSWNLFILVTSLLSLISGIAYTLLPESPKFLMSKGDNDGALRVLKKIYRINCGQSEENYPIKKLICEYIEDNNFNNKRSSYIEIIKNGWQQVSPLFGGRNLKNLILVTAIMTMILGDLNTLRMWIPQIFQASHEYQAKNATAASLCMIIESLKSTEDFNISNTTCSVNLENNFSVYFNSMVIAIVYMVGYAMAGTMINMFKRKTLLCILGITCSITVSTMYFSESTTATLILSSLNLTTSGVFFDIVMTIIVVIFPTTLRGMAISVILLIGRLGGIVGNIIFPALIQMGCAPTFFTIGAIVLLCTLLCFLLPSTDKTNLV